MPLMTYTAATALLSAQCQASVYPTLSGTELDALLTAQVSFVPWTASTAFNYGDTIIPTVPNGHLYRCIVAGTSGLTEPPWPLFTNPDSRVGVTRPNWYGWQGPVPGSQIADGSALVWIEAGADSLNPWNVRAATYNAWLQKAAKASADYDVALDRDTYDRSQVTAACLLMAKSYAPYWVA